jgi:lipoprotein-anchoring transpeptidase ErfK/SrfK
MKIVQTLALSGLLAFSSVSVGLAAKIEVVISKVSQKMTVKIDGQTEYVWPVSTGTAGYDTPSGKFRPFRLEEEHYSKEWDDAPMPYSVFFTERGHAIHGTQYVKSLGRRASHGCVRLSETNAATLFGLVQDNGLGNTSVVIKGGFFDFSYASDPPQKPFAIQKSNGVKVFASGNSKNTSKSKKKKKKKSGLFSSL